MWIIQEYFPQVGWRGLADKELGSDEPNLRHLMRQMALLHAHSRSKIEELRRLSPPDGALSGSSCSACPATILRSWLTRAVEDHSLLALVAISDQERATLDVLWPTCRVGLERWEDVCVTSDWAPDNFGIRASRAAELVTFDWGTVWCLLGSHRPKLGVRH